MTQSKQSREQQLEQLRKQFKEQCAKPNVTTMKHLLVLESQTLNNIVESKLFDLVEHQTDSEPIALGVQLFVRISRQFPALPAFVVIDVVLALGNLYSQQDQFVEALSDMQMI